MPCVNPTFWLNVPVGGSFVISGSGDPTVFNVAVGVNANGHPEAVWKHNEIDPGPKSRVLNAGDNCTFHVFVSLFNAPAAGQPVVIDVSIHDAGGAPDPARHCSSSFTQAGHFPITFFVTA
jgi:hypothetical protein